MLNITYAPVADQGILMQFGNVIDEKVNASIRSMVELLKEKPIRGVQEVIPTFCSLLVLYDSEKIRYQKIQKKLMSYEGKIKSDGSNKSKLYHIPVCYGESFGEDLDDVAVHAGLSTNEVIQIHSKSPYRIYMLGFLPGFAYLGGMDERIFCPRLTSPRTKIPAGSVGIGGEQTGIYPLDSPGGWRLLGRTPIPVYEPERTPAILYEAGEYIKFDPVTLKEYEAIKQDLLHNTYHYDIEEMK